MRTLKKKKKIYLCVQKSAEMKLGRARAASKKWSIRYKERKKESRKSWDEIFPHDVARPVGKKNKLKRTGRYSNHIKKTG